MNKTLIVIFSLAMLCFAFTGNSKEPLAITTSRARSGAEIIRSQYSKQEEDSIKKIGTSFYDWYIKTIKASNGTIPFDFIIVEGQNGKCKVDFEPYFKELRKLNTISVKFMEREIMRSKECVEHMKTVSWSEFKNSDVYAYEDFCPCYTYMYWLQSQEPYDDVSILEMKKADGAWFVKLQLYNIFDSKLYIYNYFYPIVKIEKENSKWLITKIELKRVN